MDRKVKLDTLGSLLLATVYYLFFAGSKHIPSLAHANPFAEDPYDAVGSFSVQLAPFLALLCCLRAFRPYNSETLATNQHEFIAHARMIGAISVALTMLADIVALARHPRVWMATSAGRWLAAASCGLLLWSAIEAHRSWRAAKPSADHPFDLSSWRLSIAGIAAMIAALAVFPETLRHSVPGALLTAFSGGVILILPLGIIGHQLSTSNNPVTTDLVDDVIAVCEALKSASPSLAPIYTRLDRIQRSRWPLRFALWINPRRFRWRLPLLSGVSFGLALVTAELSGEGVPRISHLLLVVMVFIGLETSTVLMGYICLAEALGLFRRETSQS